MPELRSCYFCGTPDDVQQYAVVPPRFLAADEDQPSAALCEPCKEKLLRVIDPLTDRLDEQAGATSGAAAAHDADATTATSSAGGDDPSPMTGDASPSASDDLASADLGVTPNDDGVTMDPKRAADAAAGDVDAESPAGEAAADASGEESPPPNYRKAMRLLSNREFPMERYDVEELLGGAYDMEEEEIAAVLAYATESGRLADDDGVLRRA